MASNNKTSFLVSTQLPQFVRDDHPTFVRFLEAYYEFLEQEGEMLDTAKNFANYHNIDLADQRFRQKLYDNFIALLNQNIKADKDTILKHAKDFYRAKGTENAVRFLARILFNKEIEFYYPKDDILKASDGKWFVEQSLKVTDVQVNNVANSVALLKFKNQKIYGVSSNATADVETVDVYYDKGDFVAELKISGINKQFQSQEKIYTYYTEEGVDKYLTANIYSGIVVSVSIDNPGTGYIVGTTVPVISDSGKNADIKINKVTAGSVKLIGVNFGGSGFVVNNDILFTTPYGGGGVGAAGEVATVDLTNTVHDNTYSIVGTTISVEANTVLSNVVFSNLNSTSIDSAIGDGMTYWTYANCGPILSCTVTNPGQGYTKIPLLSVKSNTIIRSLNMIGSIGVSKGGLNYDVGDTIEFTNPAGTYGIGATATVTEVAANGAIKTARIGQIPGHLPGGTGYDKNKPPLLNVVSIGGYGAELYVSSFFGSGESLSTLTDSIGSIQELIIVSGGRGYTEAPYLDFTGIGDGTARANATIAKVLYVYPGRFLNDDGKISAYKFLQDKDYYQNYSYVIKISESINKYRKTLNDLVHPLGAKLFGEYTFTNDRVISNNITSLETYESIQHDGNYRVEFKEASYNVNIKNVSYQAVSFSAPYAANNQYRSSVYVANSSNVIVNLSGHGYTTNDYVYISFTSNSTANIVDGLYTVTASNSDYFTVGISGTENNVIGDSYVWNPKLIVYYNTDVPFIANVYMDYDNTDPYLNDGTFQIISANTTEFSIITPDIADVINGSGSVNVYTSQVKVIANTDKFLIGDHMNITFNTGDMANLVNGYFTVESNTSGNLVINTPYALLDTNGNASIYLKTLTFTSTNSNFTSNEAAQIWFTSGDLANVSNGIYNVDVIDSNTFNVQVSKVGTMDGTATIYSNRANFYVILQDHGFNIGDQIYMEYKSGDQKSIPNGIFTIADVYDFNTFIVYRDDININSANAVSFTADDGTGIVTVGLYK